MAFSIIFTKVSLCLKITIFYLLQDDYIYIYTPLYIYIHTVYTETIDGHIHNYNFNITGSRLQPVADRLHFGRAGSGPKRLLAGLLGELRKADFTVKNGHGGGYEWEYQRTYIICLDFIRV